MNCGTADLQLLVQVICAVQSAKAKPTEFGINSMTEDGIRGFRVLVIDDAQWRALQLAELVQPVTLPLPDAASH